MSVEDIKGYLAGLIGIPMLFEGNCLCPDCLHHAMEVYGNTYFCKNCGGRFPATIIVDDYGEKWLKLNDAL